MNRCTGHCCENFWLPVSPMELAFDAKRARLGKARFGEVEKVAAMAILIRPESPDAHGYRYTCKHFEKSTGNCLNYENRPNMCRDYPYGRRCTYKGCTLKEEGSSNEQESKWEEI